MDDVKIISVCENPVEREIQLQDLRHDYDIVGLSDDKKSVVVKQKERIVELHPDTQKPLLYD